MSTSVPFNVTIFLEYACDYLYVGMQNIFDNQMHFSKLNYYCIWIETKFYFGKWKLSLQMSSNIMWFSNSKFCRIQRIQKVWKEECRLVDFSESTSCNRQLRRILDRQHILRCKQLRSRLDKLHIHIHQRRIGQSWQQWQQPRGGKRTGNPRKIQN